jgi:ribosome-associated toxin RatA of RatAB toxin-antitoxin module
VTRDFSAYPKHFAPQILQAKVTAKQGDHLEASMRVRQHHIITVVFDIASAIDYGHLDLQHQFSIAHSTKISEMDTPGTAKERALSSSEEHGYLWRLNTYWSFEEREDGLYMQIESVSLSRSIPPALAWVIGPFVESVPRESLEFTLRSTCNALRK